MEESQLLALEEKVVGKSILYNVQFFKRSKKMSSSLLSYPESINFENGEIGSESSPVNWVFVGFLVNAIIYVFIMSSSRQEERKLLDLIEK